MNKPPDHLDTPDVDDAIRTLLVEPDADISQRMEQSFARGLQRVQAGEAPSRRRRWTAPRLAAVSAAAVSLLVVAALAPSWDDSGSSTQIPKLTSDASAAEALRWAGNVIVAEGDPAVGDGPVWHAVSVTTRDGRETAATEQWLATDDDSWEERRVHWQREPGIEGFPS